MRKIFLIGDSIREGCPPNSPGYGIFVKEGLEGIAEVYTPDENCRFAQYTLRYLHEWAALVPAEEIDTVYWNNGLWDVLRLFEDEPFTPLDAYLETLRRIHKRIRLVFPNARVIFATNTTVIEDWSDKKTFTRTNRDIYAYNAAAVKLMKELGVEVSDLCAVADRFPPEYHSDWVHFGETGSRTLAQAVIEACLQPEQ